MRLLTFQRDGRPQLGVRRDDAVVDLGRAAPDLPQSWPAIFDALLLGQVEQTVAAAGAEALLSPDDLHYLPPIPAPPKILCVGLNYHAHAAEVGLEPPKDPILFVRFPNSFVGHEEAMICPRASSRFDYEAELAVVIGKGGRHISRAAALDHVAGYAAANDGSLRDFQFKGQQWTLGKNFDASGSWGPEIVTRDELPEGAKGLAVRCRLNGETLQEGNSDDLIFDVAELIAACSEVMTLEPGDLILTGTPPGVGAARKPPVWMKPGDRVEVEIDGVGLLANPIAAEGA